MKFLLDTAPLLYLLLGARDKIPAPTARHMLSKENQLLVSAASLWEIAIKASIGKLNLTKPARQFIPKLLDKLSIQTLPIFAEDTLGVETLHFHHKDPFDRLIISQAKKERMPVITPDRIFKKYGVKVVW